MKRLVSIAAIFPLVIAVLGAGQGGAISPPRPQQTPSSPGYWLVGADGGVCSSNALFHGTGVPSNGSPIACPYVPGTSGPSVSSNGCTAIAATPTGSGYWLADSNQLPAAFGSAASWQGAGCTSLNGATGTWSGIASTPSGNGFLLTSTNGGVMGCGDATPLGGVTALHLVLPIVGMAATPDGGGHWLVANDGGVFAFGNAQFFGSMGGNL